MCGRYAITLPPSAMREAFGYREQPNFPARYNIAPTQPILIIAGDRRRAEGDKRGGKAILPKRAPAAALPAAGGRLL